jgi:hypothetical protein
MHREHIWPVENRWSAGFAIGCWIELRFLDVVEVAEID